MIWGATHMTSTLRWVGVVRRRGWGVSEFSGWNFLKLLWGQCWLQPNGKKPINWPHKINELILKTKADLEERPDSHPRIIFPFNWLVIIWKGHVCLKLDVQCQRGGRILDVARQGGCGRGGEGSSKLEYFHGQHVYRPFLEN